ncbi:MAG: endonuclease III [Thermodesulfovibrionales bacterium]|nr:endonuclease III [Thermodesulfovibrionales bacterium]
MTKKDFINAWGILKQQVKGFDIPWVEADAKEKKDPFRVLISCIISLRTKDNVTEMVSERLFAVAKDINDLSRMSERDIERLIYPTGFYKRKAKVIKEICDVIIKDYNGQVPNTIDSLLKLKGVGRKTANLVLSLGYGQDAICVDTHVHRIPNRWGLINTKTPKDTEFALSKVIPKKIWKEVNGYLVSFGQNICKPVSPVCSRCSISLFCKRIGVNRSR